MWRPITTGFVIKHYENDNSNSMQFDKHGAFQAKKMKKYISEIMWFLSSHINHLANNLKEIKRRFDKNITFIYMLRV